MSIYSHNFILIPKITPITLKTMYSISQLAAQDCTPEGKGRIILLTARWTGLLSIHKTWLLLTGERLVFVWSIASHSTHYIQQISFTHTVYSPNLNDPCSTCTLAFIEK